MAYEGCEYVVLEAGLGGEHDATNVLDKVLSVFTPIDFDHSAFLGNTIESIASTKLRSMQHKALLGKQKHVEVEVISEEIAKEKGATLYRVGGYCTPKIIDAALHLAIENNLSDYLRDNLTLAMAAYTLLGYEVEEDLFDQAALFGRLSRIAPNVTLDVGHNALAAQAIAQSYSGKKVILIYNSYGDKEYREILTLLSPIIEKVEIIDVDENRIVQRSLLETVLEDLGMLHGVFESIREDKEYLVFGSFSVAEAFLKRMNLQ
jgi:dihydrofolate synthase/folylpolyglutamate synthase